MNNDKTNETLTPLEVSSLKTMVNLNECKVAKEHLSINDQGKLYKVIILLEIETIFRKPHVNIKLGEKGPDPEKNFGLARQSTSPPHYCR